MNLIDIAIGTAALIVASVLSLFTGGFSFFTPWIVWGVIFLCRWDEPFSFSGRSNLATCSLDQSLLADRFGSYAPRQLVGSYPVSGRDLRPYYHWHTRSTSRYLAHIVPKNGVTEMVRRLISQLGVVDLVGKLVQGGSSTCRSFRWH
jgi:hypothetical protein